MPTPLEHWPLFVRDGSVIPLGESARNTDDAAGSPITLLVTVPAPAATPRPPFVWYEDNGQDLAYRVGDFRQVPLQCRREDAAVVVEIGPVTGGRAPNTRDLHLEVWGLDSAPGRVQVNGSPADGVAWDTESRRLTLPVEPPGEGTQLRITLTP